MLKDREIIKVAQVDAKRKKKEEREQRKKDKQEEKQQKLRYAKKKIKRNRRQGVLRSLSMRRGKGVLTHLLRLTPKEMSALLRATTI
ncbi:hypothetical protein DPMN_004028 [Dreissena polymorpha]|uniref:Uncharacterized protein n=1 Tax=Dreissena polymorpha TaxID=45954 RepID=A0A9D4MMP7_DREPO|nr:hypothetical protein DPMN_004028 [Dreissena polymorpha]